MNSLAWSLPTVSEADDVRAASLPAGPPPALRDDPLLMIVDASRLASPTAATLSQRGFRVLRITEFGEVEAALQRRLVSLVILVAGDARGEGLDLCRRIAQRGSPPILMLSAEDSAIDRILGLELGADDCLYADCDPRELVARVRALLRRPQRDVVVRPADIEAGYRFGDCHLDVARRELRRADGAISSLSPGELMLLRVFLENPQEILSRDRLAAVAAQADAHGPRTIDVQVSRLRRKLGRKADGDDVIRTVYGAGYMLTAPVVAF